MKQLIICLFAILFCGLEGHGQSSSTYVVVNQIDRTRFMEIFDSTRQVIEKSVWQFKFHAKDKDGETYNPDKYKASYNKIAKEYNKILLSLTEQLETRRGRKNFVKKSAVIFDEYYSEYEEITQLYNKELAELNQAEVGRFFGAGGVIFSIINFGKWVMKNQELIAAFKHIKTQLKEVENQMLEKLIEKHKYQMWDEIGN